MTRCVDGLTGEQRAHLDEVEGLLREAYTCLDQYQSALAVRGGRDLVERIESALVGAESAREDGFASDHTRDVPRLIASLRETRAAVTAPEHRNADDCATAEKAIADLAAQRDEARAEVERLRELLRELYGKSVSYICRGRRNNSKAKAEKELRNVMARIDAALRGAGPNEQHRKDPES